MTHPYADILKAIIAGEQHFEARDGDSWQYRSAGQMLQLIGKEDALEPERYRVKPDVILIGAHEVPTPLRVMPERGTFVFWPDMDAPCWTGSMIWNNSRSFSEILLKRGMLHLTAAAAIRHAKALIALTEWPT